VATKKVNPPKAKATRRAGKAGKPKKSGKTVKTSKSVKAVSMDDLLKKSGYEFNVPQHGSPVTGVITEVTKKIVLVDIGAKTEGMVVDREYESAYGLIQGLSVGDKIKALVVSPENERGQILLSLKKEATQRAWDHYDELMKTGDVLVVRGLEVNRGGLIVRADGIRGFIPSSQFGKSLADKMDELVNRPIKVKVIEVEKTKNRLIFSERHVSEAGVLKKREEALKYVSRDDVLDGVISGVMPFGAFVTVRVPIGKGKTKKETVEVDGLVHISEISWEKVRDPKNHFKKGQKLKVMVLSIDKDSGKLNLSVKRLSDDPWAKIEKKFKVGSKHKGKVIRVEPFGVFVNFEAGVDGLIHISKIPAGEEPEVGKSVDVFVETVDSENRRMSLSMVLKTTEKLIYK